MCPHSLLRLTDLFLFLCDQQPIPFRVITTQMRSPTHDQTNKRSTFKTQLIHSLHSLYTSSHPPTSNSSSFISSSSIYSLSRVDPIYIPLHLPFIFHFLIKGEMMKGKISYQLAHPYSKTGAIPAYFVR